MAEFSGLRAVIEYYDSTDKVDENWFAFIVNEGGTVMNRYYPEVVGRSLEDLFGPGALEATAEGNWLDTGDLRVWVVRNLEITLCSGWRHDEVSQPQRAVASGWSRHQARRIRTRGRPEQ